jgi:hypothetical protein
MSYAVLKVYMFIYIDNNYLLKGEEETKEAFLLIFKAKY